MECLTGPQLAGWADYAHREPFGFPIDDVRSGMTMAVIANAAGGETAHTDFLLGPSLLDPLDEEGLPSDDALTLKLKKLLPPPPPPGGSHG